MAASQLSLKAPAREVWHCELTVMNKNIITNLNIRQEITFCFLSYSSEICK